MPKARETSGSATRRIQMDMPPKSVERLERLRDITEAASYAEVMRNALRLYEAMIEEVEAGNEIFVKRDGVVAPLAVFAG
ncbi:MULTISPECIES: hypothetical protein [unclassified Sphingobium]|uniref:hypothetical protein n=1 Tax=unclassified Sphingobium TaxID=2611147 RepID=UPI000D16740A|nr:MULTISPECIES: hypothetical protein [unclassified Sphingobium]MBG6119350.1 Arc/MetJ-type ribon-helix-helix transcriptional regulator [Sphingobium sp. JAI105]PSO10919.1 hypothetical protein C7E20_14365 [Sphingobium sp. AEW4]TWD04820.1 hypothetical protein FB595_111101 [Sphingobium sp. AEW010]TWD22228.1 hypothetical protein FB596_111101 [Sphingobium sp. AEW013]TWD24717.1 hypothetical protein FB594_111101 [Sphingobium sp. AEW001]